MTEIPILFDEKEVSDLLFERMDLGRDDVDTHLVEKVDRICQKPFLVVGMQFHHCVSLGVLAVDLYLVLLDDGQRHLCRL